MEFSEISPFLEYFERVRGRTRAVAECVPEEAAANHVNETLRPSTRTVPIWSCGCAQSEELPPHQDDVASPLDG